MYLFFFFQAEDGIRDLTVTGVQTCALPICGHEASVTCRASTRSSRRCPERGDRDIRLSLHAPRSWPAADHVHRRSCLSRRRHLDCCCNVKMSSPNCSVKRSSLNGDLHVEPEGT